MAQRIASELVFVLDRPRQLGDFLTVHDLDANGVERSDTGQLHSVHRQASVPAPVPAQQIVDLRGEALAEFVAAVAGFEIEKRRAGPHFTDQGQVPGEHFAAVEIPQDHRSLGGYEADPAGIVGHPELHVAGVGGVADVERVPQQNPSIVAGPELFPDAFQPILTQGRHIGWRQAERLPQVEGPLRGSDFHPVVVVRGAVGAGGGASGGIDLAIGAADRVRVVHGPQAPG